MPLTPQVFYMEPDFLSFPNNGTNQEIFMLTKLQTATSNMSGKILEPLTPFTFTLHLGLLSCYWRPKDQLVSTASF